MRILHVIANTEVGGGSEYLVQLAGGLRVRGVESRVVTGVEGEASARLLAGGTAVSAVGRMGPATLWPLARAVRAAPLDVLHLHGSRSGLLGAVVARGLGLGPVVYTAHVFSFHRRMRPPLRWLAARAESVTCGVADAVICLTHGDLASATRHGLPTARFRVVPNGIDLGRFPAPADRRAELGFRPDTPVVGVVARLVPQKDPVSFVRIAARVAAARPDACFVLVGEGELRAEVERQVRALGLDGRLQLTGVRHDIPELLASLDVVVFPSLWEGHPLTLLEAMAAGRAVVVSALPGHAEVVTDGVNGLIAAPGDIDGFASRVLELLDQPARRAALGQQARETVGRSYSVDRTVESTLAIYRDVLGRSSAGRTPAGPAHSS